MASRFGIKPEELIKDVNPEDAQKILEERERKSGLTYDNPTPDQNEKNEEEQERVIETPIEKVAADAPRPSLGRSITTPPPTHAGMETGWKNLPLHLLPTQGNYYPEGTQIAIRAAEVKEIRHYSSIDDADLISIEDKLNYILDKCTRIYFGESGLTDYRDIKYEDRFYIILAIRDLTFLRGENRILLKPKVDCVKTTCPLSNGIELRTGVLSRFQIDDNIMKYYSPEEKIFQFYIPKMDRTIPMAIPSIGVMERLTSFYKSGKAKGQMIDDSFRKIAPYIFEDWRQMNDGYIISRMREIDYWTKEEFSLAFEMSGRLKVGTKTTANIKCNCGAEVTAPISFPGGYRSIFVISDIFRDIL
jgi:hypothetical protein